MVRRAQLAVAVVVIFAMLSIPLIEALSFRLSRSASAQSVPPSILVIQTDDMRFDDLAAMPKTRALLQARGMTFDNYIAGGTPLCCPNRSTALTGLYPHNHGVLMNSGPNGGHGAFKGRGNELRTIGVALKGVGYRTAFIGKYMNRYPSGPNGQVPPGWDNWHAIVMDLTCKDCRGGGPGNGYYYGYRLNQNGRVRAYGDRRQDYSTNVFTRTALSVIASNPASTPLFLWVNPMAPHGPLVPGPGHKRASVHRGYKTPAFNQVGTGKVGWIKNLPRLKRPLIAYLNRTNAGRRRTLLAVDDMVAKLVPAMPPGSWIFFVSDNGYMLGEFRIPVGKVVPYKPSAEVPLVVVGPGVTPGSYSGDLVSSIDLTPTWAAIAGIDPYPWPVDGISILPILTPGAPGVDPLTPRDEVLLEWGGSIAASATADLDGDIIPSAVLAAEARAAAEPTPAGETVEADRKNKKKKKKKPKKNPKKKRPGKKRPGKGRGGKKKPRRGPEKPNKASYAVPPYYALRGETWLYIEWSNGHREYYDHRSQPYELINTYNYLPPTEQVSLATRVQELKNCQGAEECSGSP